MSKSHLRGLGLEGCLASETLEDDCAEGPEIGLCIVLERHDHLWSLKQLAHLSIVSSSDISDLLKKC